MIFAALNGGVHSEFMRVSRRLPRAAFSALGELQNDRFSDRLRLPVLPQNSHFRIARDEASPLLARQA